MKLKYLLAASIVSLAATTTIATPAFAQETTSSVRGTVTDENGAAVVGATVTVTHVPSGTTSTQTTDGTGSFNAAACVSAVRSPSRFRRPGSRLPPRRSASSMQARPSA